MEDALRNAAAFRVAGGQVADEEVLPDVGIKTRDLRDQILGVNHFNPETAWITMQITRCFTKYVFFLSWMFADWNNPLTAKKR